MFRDMASCGTSSRPRHLAVPCRQTLPDLLRRPPKVDPLRHDRGLSWAHVSAPPESGNSQVANSSTPPGSNLVSTPMAFTEGDSSGGDTDSEEDSLASPPPLLRIQSPIIIAPQTDGTEMVTESKTSSADGPINSNQGLESFIPENCTLVPVDSSEMSVKLEPMDTDDEDYDTYDTYDTDQVRIKTEPGEENRQNNATQCNRAVRPVTLNPRGILAPIRIDLRDLVPKVEAWNPGKDNELSPPPVDCPNPLLVAQSPSTIYSIGMALANSQSDKDLPELKVEELQELELPELEHSSLRHISLEQLQTASEQLNNITKQLRPGSKAYGVIQNGTLTGILGDPNIAVADSNSPKQAFVPCKVCGDKASGYHYGVTSCEGCKGFFRRSIQKQIEYRCLRDGKCLVMRLNRNRCQYCRFKKCLAVGMSRDSVRYGRVPKRTKSQDEQRVSTSAEAGQEQSVMESKQLAIYDIILAISHAHHANCILTEDKVKNLSKKTFSLVTKLESIESMHHSTSETMEAHRIQMFQNLAAITTPSIQRVVEFAKRVPGFHDVSQDDQLVLIKSSFFEIWLTRMIRMFNHTDGTIMFGDGCVIPRAELEIIFTPEMLTDMFSYSSNFCQLRLNDTEIGLFTGIVLATADRSGLTDNKAVECIQDKLIEALKLQISRNHAMEPSLFASILMKLPELRSLGSKHNDLLGWFRERWNRLQLPPLLAEIYDIPKLEEDMHGMGAQLPFSALAHGGAHGGQLHQAGHPPPTPGANMHNHHQMAAQMPPGPQPLPPIQVSPLQGAGMGSPGDSISSAHGLKPFHQNQE